MKINGVEFKFDAYDLEDVEKAQKEMNKVVAALKNPPRNFNRIEGIKYTVKIVSDCLDNIFGKGSAEKVFKGKTNMKLALKAFEEITIGMQEQDSEFKKEIEATREKYSPNRAERRNNRYNKKNKK
ncbi:TPA: DUF6673 family protein [Clostridium perfringens]|jgi:hypothetical protein|uniref:DUF6673 family protein n=1 Tax=Clostridium perfringens TaxID=1502 RepID=UPI000E4B844E|nr:DUF6673 family protein [Clostridium perfringens]MDM0558241.1 hypothetical protein [Clostridium perfringens]MDM0633566.1 hypothetical protein [Clostridium perfringens]MDM0822054.1 hypothetical protein [Clostridium perfringens]MDM0987479.1 hypothetical protein [Clostridium perfringens]NGT56625.1 hypothetical protein [Clostridium perfringens]